ncbi:glycoside hydrolase family 105 protein [Paenibacillus thailandensis]|uniref:Glycoside hydrolase family 105 protein n=1 Tax=Paenibacillus thailandensis TaxID=393250 RepID=A0ABW5R3S1_9BACL
MECWSEKWARPFMDRYPLVTALPFYSRLSWNYEIGCLLTAMEKLWRQTGERRYFDYVKANMDLYVREDGSIRGYSLNEYNVDQINSGKPLFALYRETGESKYKAAIELLAKQLKSHPRTSEGGLWHKKIYPFQMWLDGVYMTAPFMTAYAALSGDASWFDEAANEVALMENKARDPVTGLLYHAWDESKEQRWADPVTGCSPHFWGRAVGWFMMALADVLDDLPVDHPKRGLLVGLFYRLSEAVMRMQDEATGLWHQILDQGGREGNYLETSASAMFVYALAKGSRFGYLTGEAADAARRGFEGIVRHAVSEGEDGALHLDGICKVAGLGGRPYRDGSYAYYIGEPKRQDDPKGTAAFLMAAIEIELLERQDCN